MYAGQVDVFLNSAWEQNHLNTSEIVNLHGLCLEYPLSVIQTILACLVNLPQELPRSKDINLVWNSGKNAEFQLLS